MRRGKGLAIVGGVIIGELRDHWEAADQARAKLKAKLRDAKIEGFPEVVVARSESEGHLLLVQCKGLGVLRPNAVMIGWPTRVRAMAEAQRVSESSARADAKRREKEEKDSDGDDDDEMRRLRAKDDWKDNHTRGAGNRKNIS